MSKIIPVTINNDNQILDYEKINGRVNLLEEPSPEVLFKMQERVAVKNKTSQYREALNIGVTRTISGFAMIIMSLKMLLSKNQLLKNFYQLMSPQLVMSLLP